MGLLYVPGQWDIEGPSRGYECVIRYAHYVFCTGNCQFNLALKLKEVKPV